MTAPLVRRSPAHSGTVVANEALTARMRRVTVRSEAMVGMAIRPAQDVELLLREAGGSVQARIYPGLDHVEIIGAFAGPLRFLAPSLRDCASFMHAPPEMMRTL